MVKGFTPEYFYGLGGANGGKEYNLVDITAGAALIRGMSEPLTEEDSKLQWRLPVGPEKTRALINFSGYTRCSDFTSNLNKSISNTDRYGFCRLC
jgi:hypothetical protein